MQSKAPHLLLSAEECKVMRHFVVKDMYKPLRFAVRHPFTHSPFNPFLWRIQRSHFALLKISLKRATVSL